MTAEFVRLGDVLKRTAERLREGEEARAYAAWSAAAGAHVTAAATPVRLARGTLVLECESSVWAQELTYLSGEFLAKMHAADPDCPVERLRFVSGRRPR
ncbi:MAG: DUF721 domain-containing protein [Actinobacteria bacterium]|nr:DUF721 domain-containing protein [Actinomycetota bacterium]